MKRCIIKIETNTENGCITKTLINGVDYSPRVHKIEYVHKGGEVPLVRLALVPDELEIKTTGDLWIKKVSIGESDADAWIPMGSKPTKKEGKFDGLRRWLHSHFQCYMDE